MLLLFVWVIPFAYLLSVFGLFVREVRSGFPFLSDHDHVRDVRFCMLLMHCR